MTVSIPTTPAEADCADDLVHAVKEIGGLITKSVPESIRIRTLPDRVVLALDAKGITRMTWARDHGGSQLSMTEQHEVLRALGECDGSTAWTMAINAAMPYMISLFGNRTTLEVLNSENSRACGVFALTGTATPTTGGVLVSGRWAFVSGQNHSGWVLVPATFDGTERLALLVPRSEFTVGDEWDVNGLIGTGSNTLTLEDTFVPQHRAIPLDNILSGVCSDPETTDHDPYYRQPLVPIICALSAGPAVGMARHALTLFMERIHKRGITYSAYPNQAEAPATHVVVAEATALIDEADRCGRRAAETIDHHTRTGQPWDVPTRVQGRYLGARAVKLSADAVEIIAGHAGANATIRRTDPLATIIADLRALKQHSFLLYSTCAEEQGRSLCGLKPSVPFF